MHFPTVSPLRQGSHRKSFLPTGLALPYNNTLPALPTVITCQEIIAGLATLAVPTCTYNIEDVESQALMAKHQVAIYLEDDLHDLLKALAFKKTGEERRRVTVTDLFLEALQNTFGGQLAELRNHEHPAERA